MSVGAWRVAIWAGIAVTLFFVCGDIIMRTPPGTYGYSSNVEVRGSMVVTSVHPGGPAARAGIVAGDRLQLADNSLATRLDADSIDAPGDPLPLWVSNAHARRYVVLRADAVPIADMPLVLSYEVLRLVMLAIAALLIVRRSERADARALATFYVAFAFGFLGRPPWFPPDVRMFLLFARPICVAYALERAAYFTATFPQPARAGLRKLLPRISQWVLAVSIVAFSLPALGTMYLAVRTSIASPWLNVVIIGALCYFLLAIVAGLVLGGRDASPADRARLRWVGASFVVGLACLIPAVALERAGVADSHLYLLPLGLLAIPIGSAYAILRHRLLDLGFVINRALVFAILSALVVASFSLLEFVLGRYLAEAGHVESITLEAGLALIIAFSLRTVHERVDRFVDSVFFRQRHLAEQALGRLTHEVAHMTERESVVERTLGALDRHLRVTGSALYFRGLEGVLRLQRGTLTGAPEVLAENDPVVVRLKTFREPVDLSELIEEGVHSQLLAQLALPMVVRGDIVGLLAVGKRRDEETLGPDEVQTLAGLALAVGVALDSLQTEALRSAVDRVLTGGADLETLRAVRAPAELR